jgi:Ca2+-transporting ATPase
MGTKVWHICEADQILEHLNSSPQGLTQQLAQQRLARFGLNEIADRNRRAAWRIALEQFNDFMILVLIAAAVISAIIGEIRDSLVILVIVVLNAMVGGLQVYRAERAIAALRRMAAPDALVLRNGNRLTIASSLLVPGDVVILVAGNIVPADLRLLAVDDLTIDESSLTGESQPVEKHSEGLAQENLVVAERRNMAFRNSLVTHGSALGVVVATGHHTEVGRIAQLLQGENPVSTPLQKRLTSLGRYLAVAALVICALVFASGLLQGQAPLLMFLTAVSLAVAAIPEALPTVVTISLALGARQLVRHNALVRKLTAVETLGSVTTICTDKTGTLTHNRMTVEALVSASGQLTDFSSCPSDNVWPVLALAMALNNDVARTNGVADGEPTELALFHAAKALGSDKFILEQSMPRIATLPFDSQRKQMTTLHQSRSGVVAYVKGAPERLFDQCCNILSEQGLSTFERQVWIKRASELANQGFRVLAFARREWCHQLTPPRSNAIEQSLTFIGLAALIDPPRSEVPGALKDCSAAGITTIMITGDHPGTAMAIARRLGIADREREMITGERLSQLSDADFNQQVSSLRVYARVSPEQKLRIVKTLQDAGEYVAMTGDGVNDAPALRRAGIGVAMGVKGTDVAREAADMVLLDDDFATIVRAVRFGRQTFANIRKFIKYTMSSNSGEIWTLFLAPFLGMPVPLLPSHILWINLITDGLPGLALTVEPADKDIMNRPPRSPGENIFAEGLWLHILWVGLFIGALSLGSMAWALGRGDEHWQTIVFTVLTVSQLFHALAVRSETESLWRLGLTSNPQLLLAFTITLMLQLSVIYLPALNTIFHTQPLPPLDLLICLTLSSLVLVAVELEKWIRRRHPATHPGK